MKNTTIGSFIIVILALVIGYVLVNLPRPVEEMPQDMPSTPSAKIDIRVACESALTYTTFPDAAAADAFVADCVAGNQPQVIEAYIQQMGLGDGAAI